jgi:hypothetical protein
MGRSAPRKSFNRSGGSKNQGFFGKIFGLLGCYEHKR